MRDTTVRLRNYSFTAPWNGVTPTFLCGHDNARSIYLVKCSAGGMLHLMCSQCYKQEIWYAQKVTRVVHMTTGEVYE